MHYSFLDISGALFSFLSTIFYIKADVRAWPVGIVAILINGTLYYLGGIYGDMALQAIYLFSMFYGWYQWLHGNGNKESLPITDITPRLTIILGIIAFVSVLVLSQFLKYEMHSKIPYWDAVTTVLSLIAQWMICKKIIQCWILWFIVDALYVGLYFYKGLPAHSILLIIYLGMAAMGYIKWRKLQSASLALDYGL